MSLLDKFFKRYDIYKSSILEIAKELSYGDKAVIREMRSCVLNVRQYAIHHAERLENRSVDAQTADEHTIMWLSMADCLIRHNYAQELDWKCEKDDFVALISSTKNAISLGCEINPVQLYDDDDVSSWCAVQDKVWFTKGACIGGIDIDSDSYVLFVCGADVLERVRLLAENIHKRIARGCDL